jgi:cytochrome c oxidase assembly factor CtaG
MATISRWLSPARAWIVFNIVVVLTQIPVVVDTLMASQAGSLVFDLAWIVAGLAFWWPVLGRWPEPGLGAAWRLLYVLSGIMVHMASGLVFAQVPFPVYRTYELAPPIPGVNPVDDQFRAGGLMTMGDALVGIIAVAFLLYAWQQEEQARHASQDLLDAP